MKTVRQARLEGYEELQKPENAEILELMKLSMAEVIKNIVESWEEENDVVLDCYRNSIDILADFISYNVRDKS